MDLLGRASQNHLAN